MNQFQLPDNVGVGAVTLAVQDLDLLSQFYQNIIGLKKREASDQVVELGTEERSLLRLLHTPDGVPANRATGLFHFAILVPTRSALAHWLKHAASAGYQLDGAADHLVSEALYLSDPEGNGIEIYRDRPREEWRFERGELIMDTLPLDLAGLLAESPNTPFDKLPAGTKMGHIHLKVDKLEKGIHFFEDVLAFDKMVVMPGAGFLSAGGYHHHVGINTWHSHNAPPLGPNNLGLKSYTLEFLEETARKQLLSHLESKQLHVFTTPSDQPAIKDPFENIVILELAD